MAQQDSLARARFKTCSDSVTAALAKAARGKKPTAPTSLIPPEVIRACGNPPPAPAVLAQARPIIGITVDNKDNFSVGG